jgi:hypothetical protein
LDQSLEGLSINPVERSSILDRLSEIERGLERIESQFYPGANRSSSSNGNQRAATTPASGSPCLLLSAGGAASTESSGRSSAAAKMTTAYQHQQGFNQGAPEHGGQQFHVQKQGQGPHHYGHAAGGQRAGRVQANGGQKKRAHGGKGANYKGTNGTTDA